MQKNAGVQENNNLDNSSQHYSIEDNSSIKKYRTETPNIIFHLGLKANVLAAYFAMKRTAGGASGQCTKSIKTLAEESGMDEKTFRKCKDALLQIQPLIHKPLIEVYKRTKTKNESDTDAIIIVDIWEDNFKYFLGGTKNGTTPGTKNGTRVVPKTAPKEEPIKKEPFKKNDIDTTSVFSDIEDNIGSFDPMTYKLANGLMLTKRAQFAFRKYLATDPARLLRNVQYYEEQANTRKLENHEKFLQYCINNDLGGKKDRSFQNEIYAKILRSDHPNGHNLKILKTVVQFYRSGQLIDSISLDLPSGTFGDALDELLNNR